MKPYQYEQNILEWLEEKMLSDPFSIIQTEFEQDAMEALVCTIAMKFNLTEKQAETRITAYLEFDRQNIPVICENCGTTLNGHRFVDSMGCVCGAIYVKQPDFTYVRDDTDRGRVTIISMV